MREFLLLCKHELKMQFLKKGKNEKKDYLGTFLSLLITVAIASIFVYLFSTVANNYILVQIDKVPDPYGRGLELLNVFYVAIIVLMSLLGTEKMRKVLTEKAYKRILLRLPVNPQIIFLSKITVLLLLNYILSFCLVVPTNIIFYLALKPGIEFIISTIMVLLVLPIVPLLISSLLIIPYILLINYLKDKYLYIFIIFTLILSGSFMLYSGFLSVVQRLLETGSIKFLFNEKFINTLQFVLKYSFPVNALSSITLGFNLKQAILVLLLTLMFAVVIIYFITKKLFYITLYKDDERQFKHKVVKKFKEKNQITALMFKEFITVFRDSKNLFSYFAISLSMPIMVYSCYSLFESLIYNTVGFRIDFSLALFIILIFSVLTNTFCATNVSRDGLATLKIKALPVKASKILLSKVLFCMIVSSLAVILSSGLLMVLTNLNLVDGLICMAIGIAFSLAQILIATKLDLNHTKITENMMDSEREASKTIAKFVLLGLIISLLIGILSIVITIFANGSNIDFIVKLQIVKSYAYIIPAIIVGLYLILSFVYYFVRIEEKYANLVV